MLMTQQASPSAIETPPDELPGRMNLWWPQSVPYRKRNDISSLVVLSEMHQDMDQSGGTATQQSASNTKTFNHIYTRDLEPELFRLAYLQSFATPEYTSFIIHVSLETYELDNCPEYETVSYTWAGENNDSTRRHPVYFGNYWDILFHTKNCWDMLRSCAPTKGTRLLWVDALCINQSSVVDRGVQVANMRRIYLGCLRVVAYLGPDIAPDLPPNRYPRRFLLQDIEAAFASSFNSSPLSRRQLNLVEVLACRYFTRIWVIQELVLPKQALIRIGDVDFTVDMTTREFLHQATPSTAAPWLRYGISGGIPENSICELMARTMMSDSQDPRDRLFGVLGLLGPQAENEGHRLQLRADYSLSFQAVSIGFFSYCLIYLKMPHILLGSRGLLAGDHLPSWVPDWSSRKLWDRVLARRLSDCDSTEFQEALSQHSVAAKLSGPSEICSVGVLDRTSPLSGGAKTKWEARFQVDRQTGALTMRLTRLCKIDTNPAFVKNTETARMFAVRSGHFGLSLVSHFPLNLIVHPGLDQLFFLDAPSTTTKIFLILRKLKNSSDWRLIAPCDCFFLHFTDRRDWGHWGMGLLPHAWELACVNAYAVNQRLTVPIESFSVKWLFPGVKYVKDLLVLVARAFEKSDPCLLCPEHWYCTEPAEWGSLDGKLMEFYVSPDRWNQINPSIYDEFAEFTEFASKVGLEISIDSQPWKPYPAKFTAHPRDLDSRARIKVSGLLSWAGSLFKIPWEDFLVAGLASGRKGGSIIGLLEEAQEGEYWIGDITGFCEKFNIDGSAFEVTIVEALGCSMQESRMQLPFQEAVSFESPRPVAKAKNQKPDIIPQWPRLTCGCHYRDPGCCTAHSEAGLLQGQVGQPFFAAGACRRLPVSPDPTYDCCFCSAAPMDPLSVLASVAGIATAGAALANTLFRLIKTVRHAPREIRAIAIEMSSLTATLEHLHDILTNGASYTKPSFLQGVQHVVKMMRSTQDDISSMISDQTIFARVRWMKAAGLLSDIQKHKVTLTLQTSILSAAILVKTTTAFRLQAETLVQAGQASLESDTASVPHPKAPRERAPSPPFRTNKRLPSPVRQSEIPGHVRTEDLFGQSSASTTGPPNLNVPRKEPQGQPSTAAAYRHSVSDTEGEDLYPDDGRDTPPVPDHGGQTRSKAKNKDPPDEESGERPRHDNEASSRRRKRDFDPTTHKVANSGYSFRVQGDAATFLYKLVFQDEEPGQGASKDTSDETTGSDEEDWSDVLSDNSEPQVRIRHTKRYVPGQERERPSPKEPAKVVDQLLLKWTLLSEREVEEGISESKEKDEEGCREISRYLRPDDELEEHMRRSSRSNPTSSTKKGEEEEPTKEIRRGRRVIRPTRTDTPEPSTSPENPFSNTSMPFREHKMPSPYPDYNSGMPNNQTTGGYGPEQILQPNWSQTPPFQQQPFYSNQTSNGYPYAQNWQQNSKPASEHWNQSKTSFKKPTIVVLPQADGADFESGPTTPELDVSCLGLSIVRQGEEAIWNSDNFTARQGIPGKAIMAALVGDKSARHAHGLDLAHTLIRGQSAKIVYVRGNDLGETWFINDQPVFLQFYHCGYLPQFYPAKENDEMAREKDYVAVGEEWASFEAMSQLGLSIKGRDDGRVLLDPSVTWSMVKELAITTLQLRCMRQRRQFTPTFYNSIAMFRKKHGDAEPEIPATLSEEKPKENPPESMPSSPKPATKLNRQESCVFDFEVKEENKKASDKTPALKKTQSAAEIRPSPPRNSFTLPTLPPISQEPTHPLSTLPPIPQQLSPGFDQDDTRSDISSATRLSRFIQRCKPGGRHGRTGHVRNRHSTSRIGSETTEWRAGDKRSPPTPSDSGIGSSIS
ncbi:hypothetical protein FDECE_12065 [Fusarium decemcellulare]|nr:hypothetical protein FDECE_12065 [Fusarium decemcellulare]